MALRPGELYFSLKVTTPERYMSFTGPDRILRFGPDEGVFSDTVVFSIEMAENGLVHIRSVYSNLYWVREIESEELLSVAAVDPVEDTGKVGCTLFRPNVPSNNRVSFQHVRSQLNVVVQKTEPYYLTVANAAPTEFSFFEFREDCLKIPKYISFRGDNGILLAPRIISNRPYLQFLELGTPEDKKATVFETFVTRTGQFRFKSLTFDMLWRVETSRWVMVDYADEPYNDPNNPETIFNVSYHSYGHLEGIGLRSMGKNDKFCERQDEAGGLKSCLALEKSTVGDVTTVLQPIDPCNSTITITSFRQGTVEYLDDYIDQDPKELINDTKEDKEVVLNKLSYFCHSVTINNRIKMYLPRPDRGSKTLIGRIPIVNEDAQFEIPDKFTTINNLTWNSDGIYATTFETYVKVVVPAKTKLTVRVMGRKARCWAPFSYTETSQFGSVDLTDGTLFAVYTYARYPDVTESRPL